MVRVGLCYGTSGVLPGANLANEVGSGYRFGYFDKEMQFHALASTQVKNISIVKTQNVYYGKDPTTDYTSYTDQITSGVVVGCYHVRLGEEYGDFTSAQAVADSYEGGFVAYINGTYQVRIGAYTDKDQAQSRLDSLGEDGASVVGTSGYGLSVVETKTSNILFQYDQGAGSVLAVSPDAQGREDAVTWCKSYKYYGAFCYQRLSSGSNITVSNVVDLETYVKGVIPYEMGRSWPLEALKAQAICARTYVARSSKHTSLGFDVCNTADCQVYRGAGNSSASYGPTDVSNRAVEETEGQYAWYKGNYAETYYSSSHGGASENVYYVWGSSPEKYPYLCGVEDPYEADTASINAYSSWTRTFTKEELTEMLHAKNYGLGTTVESLTPVYSDLGNVIELRVTYANGKWNTFTPKEMRYTSWFNLPSIRFTINSGGSGGTSDGYTVNGTQALDTLEGAYVISGSGAVSQLGKESWVTDSAGEPVTAQQGGQSVSYSADTFVFEGSGWGHQLGMSQFGAYAMANRGFTYDEIIEFYFPGVTVGHTG